MLSTVMSKTIPLLIGMALLSGPLAAQSLPPGDLGPPQVVPILEFVSAIETGAYGHSIDAEGDALLDFAALTFITQPFASAENAPFSTSIVGKLTDEVYIFNNYWLFAGPKASIFPPSNDETYIDDPPITASYIYGDIVNYEFSQQQIKAPEMNADGAAGALTLLFGAMFVLLGRRSSAVSRSPSPLT